METPVLKRVSEIATFSDLRRFRESLTSRVQGMKSHGISKKETGHPLPAFCRRLFSSSQGGGGRSLAGRDGGPQNSDGEGPVTRLDCRALPRSPTASLQRTRCHHGRHACGRNCDRQTYLRGDGTLGCWRIFNTYVFSGYGQDCYVTETPESPVDSGFSVAVEMDGKTFVRPLNRDGFSSCQFAGEYPVASCSTHRDSQSPDHGFRRSRISPRRCRASVA